MNECHFDCTFEALHTVMSTALHSYENPAPGTNIGRSHEDVIKVGTASLCAVEEDLCPHTERCLLAASSSVCADVWSACSKQLIFLFQSFLQPYLSTFFIPFLHPCHLLPTLIFSVVVLFLNLSCCDDRLRQRALCWWLWAEPLRGWDKAELTSGFSCIMVSFETASEKGENAGKAEFVPSILHLLAPPGVQLLACASGCFFK